MRLSFFSDASVRSGPRGPSAQPGPFQNVEVVAASGGGARPGLRCGGGLMGRERSATRKRLGMALKLRITSWVVDLANNATSSPRRTCGTSAGGEGMCSDGSCDAFGVASGGGGGAQRLAHAEEAAREDVIHDAGSLACKHYAHRHGLLATKRAFSWGEAHDFLRRAEDARLVALDARALPAEPRVQVGQIDQLQLSRHRRVDEDVAQLAFHGRGVNAGRLDLSSHRDVCRVVFNPPLGERQHFCRIILAVLVVLVEVVVVVVVVVVAVSLHLLPWRLGDILRRRLWVHKIEDFVAVDVAFHHFSKALVSPPGFACDGALEALTRCQPGVAPPEAQLAHQRLDGEAVISGRRGAHGRRRPGRRSGGRASRLRGGVRPGGHDGLGPVGRGC
eukprot:scaffold1355_cov268-Pinguiococcus_pyrenoidosus.AAC.76